MSVSSKYRDEAQQLVIRFLKKEKGDSAWTFKAIKHGQGYPFYKIDKNRKNQDSLYYKILPGVPGGKVQSKHIEIAHLITLLAHDIASGKKLKRAECDKIYSKQFHDSKYKERKLNCTFAVVKSILHETYYKA